MQDLIHLWFTFKPIGQNPAVFYIQPWTCTLSKGHGTKKYIVWIIFVKSSRHKFGISSFRMLEIFETPLIYSLQCETRIEHTTRNKSCPIIIIKFPFVKRTRLRRFYALKWFEQTRRFFVIVSYFRPTYTYFIVSPSIKSTLKCQSKKISLQIREKRFHTVSFLKFN